MKNNKNNYENDYCEVPYCRNIADLTYLEKDVCDKHYTQHCEGKINLKEIFNLEGVENEY